LARGDETNKTFVTTGKKDWGRGKRKGTLTTFVILGKSILDRMAGKGASHASNGNRPEVKKDVADPK